MPGVAEKQGVDCLGVGRELRVSENEVRELREAIPRDRIGGVELHVLLNLFERATDVLHRGSIAPTSPALSVINS